MHDLTTLDCSRIAQDLQIRKVQVESVVQLLDEGNTIPFITRYRKERTGGLNEEVIRQVQMRVNLVRQLADRKQTILKSIESQGKLTDDLRHAVLAADTMKRLEDLYLPYKPKKRTLATSARERGLEPLALAIWHNDPAVACLDEVLPTLVNPEKELATPADVQTGVQHILAEMIAETADVRAAVRAVIWETGKICAVKSDKLQEGQGLEYKDYFQFSEPLRQIPPHRILALNRGEKENAVKTHLEWDKERATRHALRNLAEYLEKGGKGQGAANRGQGSGETRPEGEGQEGANAAGESVPPSDGAQTQVESPPPPTGEAVPIPVGEALVTALTPVPQTEIAPPAGEPLSPESSYRTPHAAFFKTVFDDALARLLQPSLEREIRNELTDEAEGHAVAVFARNLRSLLMQPPLHHRRVLAIDPGFRTGCKVAALDEYGNLLEHAIIYPHAPAGKKGKEKPAKEQAPPAAEAPAPAVAPAVEANVPPPEATPPSPADQAVPPVTEAPAPAVAPAVEASIPPPEATPPSPADQATPPAAETPAAEPEPSAAPPAEVKPQAVDKREDAREKLYDLATRHHLNTIAIGNGTGCRETEEFVSELISSRLPDLSYVIVNEAGASVYSVSPVGREEFPTFDATLRGTVSIGRRLQDPLSELVKVDPQHIGVGLYQHDVKRRELKESLEGVVESCVNQVGVDLNTASVPLLRHVSGLNQLVAREVVEYRKQHGPFSCRDQLLQVPNLGPARYQQAAGFLKIPVSTNPLDITWIHPESYAATHQLLTELGFTPAVLQDKTTQAEFQAKVKAVPVEEMAHKLNIGVPTLRDILDALLRPGRDPREDLPPPIFKKGILKLEDLQQGMELKGTVLNVVDFGAFVDIGLKESGLVHISQMANRYIKSPYDVVSVNDVVSVWVLAVDKERHRVSLTMIKPGTERKPPEKKPAPPAGRGSRPPRGHRPEGPPPAGQEQGPPQRRGGHGRGRGAPPGRRPAPAPAGAKESPPAESAPPREGAPPKEAVPATPATPGKAPPPGRPAVPHRRHHRREPVKLSKDALEGKVPLRTFGELSALFAAKRHQDQPAPVPAPPSPEPAPPPPTPEPAAVVAPEPPAPPPEATS